MYPDSRFSKEIKRNYIDYGFEIKCFLQDDRYYYIRDYIRDIYIGKEKVYVQTYKVERIRKK